MQAIADQRLNTNDMYASFSPNAIPINHARVRVGVRQNENRMFMLFCLALSRDLDPRSLCTVVIGPPDRRGCVDEELPLAQHRTRCGFESSIRATQTWLLTSASVDIYNHFFF